MDYIWMHGPSTSEACREALAASRPMKDSTIRTVLRRLEEKGYLTHEIDGRTFVYRASYARQNVAVAAGTAGLVLLSFVVFAYFLAAAVSLALALASGILVVAVAVWSCEFSSTWPTSIPSRGDRHRVARSRLPPR